MFFVFITTQHFIRYLFFYIYKQHLKYSFNLSISFSSLQFFSNHSG